MKSQGKSGKSFFEKAYEPCIPKHRQERRSGAFIVNFEHIPHIFLGFFCLLGTCVCLMGLASITSLNCLHLWFSLVTMTFSCC